MKHSVEIINFGDELLVGIRENAHLTYLGEQFARRGVRILRNQVINDSQIEIKTAFQSAWESADVIITTGGLGPTADDLTRESIAEALGLELVYDPNIAASIERYFARIGRAVTDRQRKQCYRFKKGIVLNNERGTAPGLAYKSPKGKILILLPGPTHEMRPMFEQLVIPYLQAEGIFLPGEGYLQIRTAGVGESVVEERLEPLLENHRGLSMAFCVHRGIVDVRLESVDGSIKMEALRMIGDEAKCILGDDFVCFGDMSLAEVVFRDLRALDRTLAVAESCTGGLLCDAFTDLPGASKVFMGGVVCYNNDAKVSMVDVPETILEQHGAVSAETAIAMATGVCERFSSDYGLSITGFAGPGGGTVANPVGTIYMGYHSPIGVWGNRVRYTGERLDVKARAVNAALDWMRRKFLEHKVEEFLCQ
jgi:nicotinamide-nucleotide amidase